MNHLLFYGMAAYMAQTLMKSTRKWYQCAAAWIGAYILSNLSAVELEQLGLFQRIFPECTHESICVFTGLISILVYFWVFPNESRSLCVYYNFMITNVLVVMFLIARTVASLLCNGDEFLTLLVFAALCLWYLKYHNKTLRHSIPGAIRCMEGNLTMLTTYSVISYFGMYFIVDVWAKWSSMTIQKFLSNLSAAVISFAGYLFLFISVKNQAQKLQAERENTTDALTQLGNRKRLLVDITDLCGMQQTNVKNYLVYIDLDFFKVINDTFGHDTGDEYLCRCARMLSDIVGSSENVYRIGGDEFILLLRDEQKEIAAIRSHLDKAFAAGFPDGRQPKFLGASFGIALLEDERSIQEAVKFADTRMYETKKLHHLKKEPASEI